MLARTLPTGSNARRGALAFVAFAGLVLFTQVLLPSAHGGGRGAPSSIVFFGFVIGCINALTAAGLVLVYRTTRIINFAQTTIGAAGATFCFELMTYTKVGFPVAFALGLVLAAVTGLLVDLVFIRRFFRAPRLTLTVLTILLASFLAQVSGYVKALPFFPRLEERSPLEATGIEQLMAHLPLRGFRFYVGSLKVPFGFSHLLAIELTVLSLLALAAFFRFTRWGVAVRATAENTERSSLLGISVGSVSSVVWVLAAVLAAITVTLTGLLTTPANATGFAPGVLLTALAAAVIGRMESLPVTVGAAIGLSIVTETTSYALPNDRSLISVLILLVIAGGLLLQRRRFGRSEVGGGSSWAASEEQRPVPKELASVGSIRVARVALIAVGVIALVVYPFIASTRAVNIGGVIALYAIIAVSLVVLTGWAGQVSLGQFGFAAVGAVVAGGLSGRAGFPFWIAVPVGAAAAGAVAVVIGIPALRIKGLFLAVATLAFAFAVQATLFSKRYFGWLLPKEVQRPRLFLLDFSDERSMYFLCVAALVLVVVLVGNMRRSRVGRLLIATRDNEPNVQSFGVSVTRLKLLSFAISGAIAGFAGAIFAFQQRGLSGPSFNAGESINIFVLSILGGIGSPAGALLGSAFFNIIRYFFTGNQVVAIIFQLGGPLLVFYVVPGGLISLFMRLRDSVLRIVAQRRQIVVPSLFADLDADALEARLIPLSEPLTGAGLNALPSETHFTMRSELYRGDGERIIEKLAPAKQTKEAAALGAAAESIADRELVTVDGETQ